MKRILICVGLIGCGSSSSGPAKTPEAAMHAMIDALHDQDASAVLRAMVPTERYAAALTCKDPHGTIEELRSARGVITSMPEILRQVTFELKSIDDGGERQIAKGDTFRDCIANEPFAVHTYTLHKHVVAVDDKTKVDDADEPDEVIQLDGVWYVLGRH